MVKSRPAWGAWIEIRPMMERPLPVISRAPHGARGLKSVYGDTPAAAVSRAPHGARGLKLTVFAMTLILLPVAPRMGRVD